MVVTNNLDITLNESRQVYTIKYDNCEGAIDKAFDEKLFNEIANIYSVVSEVDECARGNKFAELVGERKAEELLTMLTNMRDGQIYEPVKEYTPEERILRGVNNLMSFFTEFDFEPNFRFVNSIAHQPSIGKMRAYITNYFRLLDNPYANDVEQKMRSKEFEKIMEDISYAKPSTRINNRLKVYYGSAGTGKTTLAQKEADNRCIVCNNSMFPSDIMEDFVFVDGNPSFNPSILWDCMEKGKPIVLDEINLLPFDTLRFLQGLLDGKKSFNYKGRTVHIKDGFEVIGTMNLSIGGAIFGLPEPLVDRCYDFKEFKLTAEQLMGALE